MPSTITFTHGEELQVTEDPGVLAGRLNANGGLPVKFDVKDGDGTKIVYVNPQHVVRFEELTTSMYEDPKYVH